MINWIKCWFASEYKMLWNGTLHAVTEESGYYVLPLKRHDGSTALLLFESIGGRWYFGYPDQPEWSEVDAQLKLITWRMKLAILAGFTYFSGIVSHYGKTDCLH